MNAEQIQQMVMSQLGGIVVPNNVNNLSFCSNLNPNASPFDGITPIQPNTSRQKIAKCS